MKPTSTKLNEKAREAIRKGVDAVYLPVAKTFGPEGRNALLYRTFGRGPRITNDGYTVAEVIHLKDAHEKLAADAFKEAAKRTNERAGDGTTCTIIVGGAAYHTVDRMLSEGVSSVRSKSAGSKRGVMSIRRDILASAAHVKEEIKKRAKPVKTLKELEHIATASVEDGELGKTIAKMAWDVGPDGHIDVVEGYKGEIETDLIKGMRFPAKVAAKAFVNNPARYEMVAQDCPVIITNHALDNVASVAAFTKPLDTAKLIIIAPSFSENVLLNLVNAFKAGFQVFPVRTPSLRTEQYEDLAVYCGATFINKDRGNKIENIKEADAGFLEKLIVKDTEAKEDAVATGGAGMREKEYTEWTDEKKKETRAYQSTAVAERVKILKAQIEETRQDIYKKVLERRIGAMTSGVGVIRVGGSTSAEGLYRMHKIEDAVYASRAALRGGYVKGGGLCLKEIAEKLPKDDILREALMAPYEQIRENADGEVEITADIIDPAESIYWAVEHATSVVAALITVEMVIPEAREWTEAESLLEVSQGLKLMAKFWARREGLLRDSELEVEMEQLRKTEELVLNDHN